MKKVVLFLGAAAIIGVGSAFTTVMSGPVNPASYVLIGTTWEPASNYPNGTCELEGDICSYSKIGDEEGDEGEFQNPENFQRLQDGQFQAN